MTPLWDSLASPRAGPVATLFEEDFSSPRDAAPDPEVVSAAAADAALLTAARAEAWSDGFAAGRAEAEAEAKRALERMGEAIGAALAGAEAAARRTAEESAEALGELIMRALAALLPETCARHGPAEALALARALLPGLLQEPLLRIRIAPPLVRQLRDQVVAELPDRQRQRVAIDADPALGPGDLAIDWERGSARRDFAQLWRNVCDVLGAAGLLVRDEAREAAHAE